jgi:hypothetical protein
LFQFCTKKLALIVEIQKKDYFSNGAVSIMQIPTRVVKAQRRLGGKWRVCQRSGRFIYVGTA